MKSTYKYLFGAVILLGVEICLSSCVTDAYVGTGVYYGGHRDPWFNDGPWVDGHRWYGGGRAEHRDGIYLHPPRGRR